MTAPETPARVVVLGGGFGGLYAARALRRAPVRLTVVDRRNHHLFQPLLYQVATAALNPSDIAMPIRRILRRQKNATVILGEATAIDVEARKVLLADGEVPYDFLIVATGAAHSYFGHDDWAPFAPGLKTIEDALAIRRRILLAFEAAERETDPARRRGWLTFVVVGGGPTGVEMAGAVAEIGRHILRRDFRSIDPGSARVVLVEAGPRILGTFDARLSEKAKRALERLGSEVVTGSPVTAIDATGVTLGGRRIDSRNVLWAAGVAASPIARSLGGRPLEAFRYRDKGSLATIGRAAAVAQFGRILLSGFVAWLAWLLIHISFLIGFRNRLVVMLEWTWLYLRYESGARLITGETGPLLNRDTASRR